MQNHNTQLRPTKAAAQTIRTAQLRWAGEGIGSTHCWANVRPVVAVPHALLLRSTHLPMKSSWNRGRCLLRSDVTHRRTRWDVRRQGCAGARWQYGV